MNLKNYIAPPFLMALCLTIVSASATCSPGKHHEVPDGWHTYVEKCFTNKELMTGQCWDTYCYDEETPIPPSFEQTPDREAEGRFCMWRAKW